MCDLDDENGPTASKEVWQNARKPHKCHACKETIRVGDRYHVLSGIWDGTPRSFKHCARCWTMLEELPEGAQLDLNCGQIWESPPDHIAALAFALPGEINESSPVYMLKDARPSWSGHGIEYEEDAF